MNYSGGFNNETLSKIHGIAEEAILSEKKGSFKSRWESFVSNKKTRSAQAIKNATERDIERGYSVNVKQVALAFAVELFIICLILFAQYLIAEEAAKDKVFTILLFPIALAVVELARVPLAIAVRTQNSWSVKIFASIGVFAAVVVTSFSLSTIAYQTFDPRLTEANEKHSELQTILAERTILSGEVNAAQAAVDQRQKNLSTINDRYKMLQGQITALSANKGESCSTVTNPDGTSTKSCRPTTSVNSAQLKTLQNELSDVKSERDEAESALRQAEAIRGKYDARTIDEKIARAQADYRNAVGRSQLHSYTSMILRKPPTEVTDAEVKSLESYLIFIPSIAAALASTLLAVTAVRRLRPPTPAVPINDAAATYLFGPLVSALRQEASEAVKAAMKKADGAPKSETV